jgi:LEA14-like dessication related protein
VKTLFLCLFPAFLILILFSSCSTIEPVTVKRLDDFQVKAVSSRPGVNFKAIIFNPNSFGLTLRSLNLSTAIGGKNISHLEVLKKTRIKPNSEIAIPVEVYPDLKELSGLLLSGSSVSEWSAEGNLVVSKFIFRKKIPFSLKGRF